MSMPKISIVMGALLCLLGVGGGIASAIHNGKVVTALIPFVTGDFFIILGVLSLKIPSARKHFMHALAMLALLGTAGGVGSATARWATSSNIAKSSQIIMAILCLITLVLCIKSFREARLARKTLN